MNKCRYCKQDGIIRKIGGMFYAQCSSCTKHLKVQGDEFQYLGSTRARAIEVWNDANPLSGGPKKSTRLN